MGGGAAVASGPGGPPSEADERRDRRSAAHVVWGAGYTGGSVAADLSPSATSTGSLPPLPPLPPLTMIGNTVVTGTAATVPVGSTGGDGLQCAVLATVTTTGFLAAPDATAAGKKPKKPSSRTVVVGTARATIRAGRSKTLKISLNRTGKRLLAKHHTLKVKLVITQKGRTVRKTTITFKTKPAHKHKH